jgi:hypothetical protein
MPIMKAVELQGEIDDQHRLHADVPQNLPAGSVFGARHRFHPGERRGRPCLGIQVFI